MPQTRRSQATPVVNSVLRQNYLPGALVVADLFVAIISVVTAAAFRATLPIFHRVSDVRALVAPFAPWLVAIWMASLWLVGAYRRRYLGAGTAEYRTVSHATALTAAVVGITTYLMEYPLSRAFYFLTFTVGLPLILLTRAGLRRLLHAARRRGYATQQVLLAGSAPSIEHFHRIFVREKWLGFDVVGALSSADAPSHIAGLPVFGTVDDAVAASRASGAAAIIFVEGSLANPSVFQQLARELEAEKTTMMVVPSPPSV